ncbi:hypothetical protein [Flavobacterium taihuense]|uniref:Uncharacterized protein n=1 Tax=Flavobacterium taihuense TaxID=2857508 RepID=A0ABS6XTT0_9FLAO|nr:hypothetical protein [Flavobacterium taihuense]MBW4360080.1 hypothetical protein [Flavobacterium taihuense]
MAQNSLNLANTKDKQVNIVSTSEETKKPATLLKTYLDQAFENPFFVQTDNAKKKKKEK